MSSAITTAFRGRPPARDGRVDRPGSILDVAEALFSLYGFQGVTVRQVADGAQVDSALVNYYFGSKRGLYDAVFVRRGGIVSLQRQQALSRYKAETSEMTVEGCLQAFFEPVFALWETGGPGWRNYLRLVGVVSSAPAGGSQEADRTDGPALLRLIAMLRECVPDAREEDLLAGCQFAAGALFRSFANTPGLEMPSHDPQTSIGRDVLRRRMTSCLATGLVEVCHGQAPEDGEALSRPSPGPPVHHARGL